MSWRKIGDLSQDEIAAVTKSACAANGGPISEDDALTLIRWVSNARVQYVMAMSVLAGEVHIGVTDDGEIMFKSLDHLTLQ